MEKIVTKLIELEWITSLLYSDLEIGKDRRYFYKILIENKKISFGIDGKDTELFVDILISLRNFLFHGPNSRMWNRLIISLYLYGTTSTSKDVLNFSKRIDGAFNLSSFQKILIENDMEEFINENLEDKIIRTHQDFNTDVFSQSHLNILNETLSLFLDDEIIQKIINISYYYWNNNTWCLHT